MILTSHSKYKKYPVLSIPLSYIGKRKRKRTKYVFDTGKFFSDAFIPAITDLTAIQIYFGGAGSGKSVSIARRTILDMLAGKRNFLIVRKVYGTLKDSFFSELKKAASELGVSSYFKFKKSPLEITCKINGTMTVFRGMDDHEKVKSITVETGIITDVIIEEATELLEDDYDLLETRLRGKYHVSKRITILFNPINIGHWLYNRFFEGRFPSEAKRVKYEIPFTYKNPDTGETFEGKRTVSIHKSTHWDNRFFDDEDRQKYESWKLTNMFVYNVYTLGNWGILGDLVFPNFHVRDLSKVSKTFDKIYDGIDFGWYPDPYAYVSCGIRGKYIYIFNEKSARHRKTREIASDIKKMANGRQIIGDYGSGGDRLIEELSSDYGINIIPTKKWKDNNSNAIAWIDNSYTIVVHYECVNFIRELETYQYDKDKNGITMRQPMDGNDHHIQAMYYAFNELIRRYRKTYIGK